MKGRSTINTKHTKFLTLILAFLLAAGAVFPGCGAAEPETIPTETRPTVTEEPTAEPTEPPTEAPTDPPVVYTNPLTGETLEEPLTTRIFGLSINNVPGALPHVGVQDADMVFEMYINDYATRCLALYTDIRQVESIGSIRSMRYNFTDLAIAYDAFIGHAGGSDEVISDANREGVDHFNVDTGSETSYSFRNQQRLNAGYGWEHCLFAKGQGLYDYAEKKGWRVTQDENKTYGLTFVSDGTPEVGDMTAKIQITFRHDGHTKLSTLTYSEELGKYIYTQYGKEADSVTEENMEAFENVFIIVTRVRNKGVYHVAELEGSGEGYYACNGKLTPILWHHENPEDPITYTLTDGTPFALGLGNSYIAIVPTTSTIEWE